MKNIKEKILILAMAASAFALCSCDTADKPNGNEENKVTTSETEKVTEASDAPEMPEVTSEVSETSDNNAAPEVPDMNEQDFTDYIEKVNVEFSDVDFDSFPSGKYVKAFREGPYNVTIHIEGDEDTVQNIYYADENLQVVMDTDGVQYQIIYMDGKMHNIYKDSYYAEAHPVDPKKYNIFGFLDYRDSGVGTYNGIECRYDEFIDLLGNTKSRIYLDDEGNMLAFESEDHVIVIDSFSEDFDKDELFTIPENVKKLSYNEFAQVMMKAFTDAAAEKAEKSDKSEPEVTTAETAAVTTGSDA